MMLIFYKVFVWLRMMNIVPLFPTALITGMPNGALNVAFNVTNMESKPRRTTEPNLTEEQCLLLAQLVDEL